MFLSHEGVHVNVGKEDLGLTRQRWKRADNPNKTKSNRTTPDHATPSHITPHRATLHHIGLHNIKLGYKTPRHAT